MRKFNIKKKDIPIFSLIALVVIILISWSIYILYMNYAPVIVVECNGYAVEGKSITRNLQTSNFSKVDKNIDMVKVEDADVIFKKLNTYYIGNNKKAINIEYPIYINNNIALLNLSSNTKLITKNYEEVDGYPDFTITSGIMYNTQNMMRSDSNEYIFLKNEDRIYTNVVKIHVKTVLNEYDIPLNSSINFNKFYISYYRTDTPGCLKYENIKDIDYSSIITINDKEYTYEELLINLKIIKLEVEKPEAQQPPEEVENKEVEEKYVKPEVSCTDFTPKTYTATTNINIKDPSGKIKSTPMFIFEKDGKVTQRTLITAGGMFEIIGLEPDVEYTVTGSFKYTDESGKEKEEIFYKGKFKTKTLEELGSVKLSYSNGQVYSNKIELQNLKINNDLSDEVIKGIARIEVQIDGVKYKLKTSQVNEMFSENGLVYTTSATVKSNSIIKYEIVVYDRFNNKLKVDNNQGETRTCKLPPTANVTFKKQDVVETILNIKLINNDNVELKNSRYIVYDNFSTKIKEGKIENVNEELILKDLDPNKSYTVEVYCDYDLEDNNGLIKNVLIGQVNIMTLPISTLGYLELDINQEEISSYNSKLKVKINDQRTDNRLIKILDEVKVTIDSNNEENIEENRNIKTTTTLTNDELEKLKNGEEIILNFDNLTSKTKFNIIVNAKARQANVVQEVGVNFALKDFKTLKIKPQIQINNLFVTGNMIDFDIKIDDIDNAILLQNIKMEIRDEKDKLIKIEEIQTNTEYVRKTYEKLDENKYYKISFYAEQYNESDQNSTYKPNYLLNELRILTEAGISGSVDITDVKRKEKGKNLVDVSSDVMWYSNNFNMWQHYGREYDKVTKITTFGGYSEARCAVYDLRGYENQNVTISFKAKLKGVNSSCYIQNSKSITNLTRILNLNNTDWQDYKYTVKLDKTGYLGFYISGGDGLQVKDLQVELGDVKTNYEDYKYNMQVNINANITDLRNEIQNNSYYIRLYKDDNQVFEEMYEEIGQDNKVIDSVKQYSIDENALYRIEILIKIRDRYYKLDTKEFRTDKAKEIKGIRTKADFLDIQPYGNYIILNDIDLSGLSGAQIRFGSTYLQFQGSIDCNGNTITRDSLYTVSPIFHIIGLHGIIENLVLDVKLNNTIETNGFSGLVETNYGTIRNMQLNLIECASLGNVSMRLTGYLNYGILENFVINLKTPFYGARQLTTGMLYNRGVIKNGYIYGNNIEATYAVPAGSYKDVGGLCIYNQWLGKISNVYSLINVNVNSQDGITLNVGNILDSNEANIENVYSVGEGNTTNINFGPTIARNSSRALNSYYFADTVYKNTYNLKVTKLALIDANFQSKLLNSEDQFNVDDLIKNGFYPQLKMTEMMPNQEYIQLPEISDKDLPDILSTDVLEEGKNNVKVKFIVNNVSGESITNITVQNLNCIILSQVYKDEKSEVIVELNTPVKYVSSYSVMSITTKGAYNIPYTRNFQVGERIINVDLYKEINSIADWQKINSSPTENYKLMTDLDFKNEADNILITNTYSGKLNGNNHYIKNITISSGREALIYYLTGQITNLYIKNYNQINPKSSQFLGVIRYARSNAIIDNVHLTDVTLEKNANPGNIGAIVADSYIVSIKNSSVTNLKVLVHDDFENMNIGGIAGNAPNTSIVNCFTQNINIKVTGAKETNMGGIAGYGDTALNIENCYSIGNILSDSRNIGGIVGQSQGSEKRCYSNVDIESNDYNLGGIIGRNNSGIQTNVLYNLALGSIYTNCKTDRFGRAIGNSNTLLDNYAYEKQLINGYIIGDELGANLLNKQQLLDKNTYINTLNFDDNYNYDGLAQGYLPKLYNTNGVDLLPNQQDNIIDDSVELEVVETTTEKTDVNKVNVRVVIKNSLNTQIDNVLIDDMQTKLVKNITQDGNTYIDLEAIPIRYYDSYKVSNIMYNENGVSKTKPVSAKIEVQFYKELRTYEDWQSIEVGTYQNYRLMNDIDFAGKSVIKTNVTMAKLETEGETKSLKNINITLNSSNAGLIKDISISLKNICFDNVNITNTVTGNYTGVIANNFADIVDVKLNNISVQALNANYVGFIGRCTSEIISNITMNNITAKGKSYVAGFAASSVMPSMTNITADNINVTGTGDFCAGVMSRVDDRAGYIAKNITIQNSNIKGASYVGGIFGYYWVQCSTTYLKSINNEIRGINYVGGIGGMSGYSISYLESDNVKVIASGSHIGGLAGRGNIYYGIVRDSYVEGTSANSNNVGGHTGLNYDWSAYNQVINTTVKSLGSNVGGVFGNIQSSTFTYTFAKSVTVAGNANVGGLVGYLKSGKVINSYNDSTVTAAAYNAGGIVGYLDNNEMTAADNTSYIYNNYVANSIITAPSSVGGVIGNIYDNLYTASYFYYQNYIQVDLISNDVNRVSLGIGGNKTQNSWLKDTYVYKYSKINGQNIANSNDNILQSQYLAEADLKLQTTYTSKLKWSTGEWDFTVLKNNKYPTIKPLGVQDGINIPLDAEHNLALSPAISTFSLLRMSSLAVRTISQINYENNIILPDVYAYAISADEINIEFSNVTDNTWFSYKNQSGYSDDIKLDKRTYTFKYNYKDPIEIVIKSSSISETKTINPEDVRRNITIVGDKYYYLNQNTIQSSTSDVINGNFVNLYKGKALTDDGRVYDIKNNIFEQEKVEDIIKEDTTKARLQYNYEGRAIEVYGKYSMVDGIEKSQIYIVKNGQISVIDGNLEKEIIPEIVDNYNEKEYQTILGNNGIMYDLKEKLQYPENFVNENIKQIDINENEEKKEVIVLYNSGKVIVFNYMTGTEIYNNNAISGINLFSFVINSFSNLNTTYNSMYNNLYQDYEKSNVLKQELISNPIETIDKLGNNNSSSGLSSGVINTDDNLNYVSMYNTKTKKFEVYNKKDLLDSDAKIVKSENEKIQMNGLGQYYNTNEETNSLKDNESGLTWIVLNLLAILAILLVMKRYTKNKKKSIKKKSAKKKSIKK